MASLGNEDLARLIETGESHRVEFKESMGGRGPEAIREAICAFANDLPGRGEPGLVFVGVRDDGSVAGLPITDELIRQLADMRTDGNLVPPPSMTVEKRRIHDADVAVVIVQPSDSPPVRYRGRIYVRVGSRRAIAGPQDERILNERRRHGDTPFDLRPMYRAELPDLNLAYFEHEYLPNAFAPEILEANDRSLMEQMAATKMIASVEEATPTVLGLLALGKSPHDFLPGAYVQFLRIEGTQLGGEIIDSQLIRGSTPDVIRRLDDKLEAHNRVAVDITSGPIERRTSLYPIPALQQLTRNAVMHRAYEGTNAPVRVDWFDDRIEVSNPGGLYGAVTPEKFGQPGLVDYRNPNLAEAMRTVGLVQRFGFGIPLVRRLLEEEGFPEPEFDLLDTHVFARVRARPS